MSKELADSLASAFGATSRALAEHVVIPREDKEAISKAAKSLREMLKLWSSHHNLAEKSLRAFLKLVTDECDHAGARHGHNERDGSWMSPCPTCGHSK